MEITISLASVLISALLFLAFYKKSKKKFDYIRIHISNIEHRVRRSFDEFQEVPGNTNWAVITSFKRDGTIFNLINDIRKYEPNVKIIVADNGSNIELINELTQYHSNGDINRILLNRNSEIPQWQKNFSISQALKLLSLEDVKSVTFFDDDMAIEKAWINDCEQILKEFSDLQLIDLLDDKIQEKNHPTIEKRIYNSEALKIKDAVNGAFFYMPKAVIRELGLPPTGEGINDASIEDGYYTRIIQEKGWRVGVINRAQNLGYENSKRIEFKRTQK